MDVPEPPEGRSNRETLSIRNFEPLEAARNEQARLVRYLAVLRNVLRSNNAIENEATESLQAIEHAAQQVTNFIKQCARAIPMNVRPSPRAAAVAMKTFGLPEIAERILLNLEPLDLLRIQQVNTTMLSTITQSPNLQRKLLLRPDPDAFFTPIDPIFARPFTTNVRFRRVDRTSEESKPVCVFFLDLEKPASLRSYDHGSRTQHMLVCQPPIFELEAHMLCGCSNAIRNAQETPDVVLGHEKLTSKSGFTLQELWDATKRLHQRHQLCPHAQPHLHDSKGFVDCPIRFEARLEVQDEDPRLVARQAWRTRQVELHEQDEQRDLRLGPYIAAKLACMCFLCTVLQKRELMCQTAYHSGQPLPTLAEFENREASSN